MRSICRPLTFSRTGTSPGPRAAGPVCASACSVATTVSARPTTLVDLRKLRRLNCMPSGESFLDIPISPLLLMINPVANGDRVMVTATIPFRTSDSIVPCCDKNITNILANRWCRLANDTFAPGNAAGWARTAGGVECVIRHRGAAVRQKPAGGDGPRDRMEQIGILLLWTS